MTEKLALFERVVRTVKNVGQPRVTEAEAAAAPQVHPFDERNVHPEVARVSRKLFDDGHFSQATFEAFKFLDNEVHYLSGVNESGVKLMMAAFAEANPKIKLTDLVTQSEIDEQSGYKFIFAGVMSAIRNPRGHDINTDPIGRCLDHLSLASVLYRRVEERKAP
ncbi:MAG TPA: TIGR02391 family protein [Ramlibacter sp.]|jgi:uncharacterized protein (TIGR02391 family)